MDEIIKEFLGEARRSLDEETFVKLNLGNYKGTDEHLQRVLIRPIDTKKGRRLSFTYRYTNRDTVKNYPPAEAFGHAGSMLGSDFFSAHLFTTAGDLQLDISKKGKARMIRSKPSKPALDSFAHDRKKQLLIDPRRRYLAELGITTSDGKVRDKQQDKWRQINKFVEIVRDLYEVSSLKNRAELSIVDMGSGKGYLTFALYDYFRNSRGLDVKVLGIEARPDLVELCNSVAANNEFSGLRFRRGAIADSDVGTPDILIALHACDTATDDALFKGIRSNAEVIVTAPCCHKEVRPQIVPPAPLRTVLRHGSLLEQTSESVTDSIRAALLEENGYKAKIFEFISPEHTPKNNMITGTKRKKARPGEEQRADSRSLMHYFGIEHQKLADMLK